MFFMKVDKKPYPLCMYFQRRQPLTGAHLLGSMVQYSVCMKKPNAAAHDY